MLEAVDVKHVGYGKRMILGLADKEPVGSAYCH